MFIFISGNKKIIIQSMEIMALAWQEFTSVILLPLSKYLFSGNLYKYYQLQDKDLFINAFHGMFYFIITINLVNKYLLKVKKLALEEPNKHTTVINRC